MNDIPIVDDLVQVNIFFYNKEILVGAVIGKLAWRSVGQHSSTVRLLGYNCHICYVSNMKNLYGAYFCSSCNQVFIRAGDQERHLTTCCERVKHVYRKNVYQLREHYLTNFSRLVVLIQTTKLFLTT